MVHYDAQRLDAVFGALADATRRAVIARLREGERTVGELAQPFGMSLTGFIKHLRILEDAGLVASTTEGSKHLYAVRVEGFSADDFEG